MCEFVGNLEYELHKLDKFKCQSDAMGLAETYYRTGFKILESEGRQESFDYKEIFKRYYPVLLDNLIISLIENEHMEVYRICGNDIGKLYGEVLKDARKCQYALSIQDKSELPDLINFLNTMLQGSTVEYNWVHRFYRNRLKQFEYCLKQW